MRITILAVLMILLVGCRTETVIVTTTPVPGTDVPTPAIPTLTAPPPSATPVNPGDLNENSDLSQHSGVAEAVDNPFKIYKQGSNSDLLTNANVATTVSYPFGSYSWRFFGTKGQYNYRYENGDRRIFDVPGLKPNIFFRGVSEPFNGLLDTKENGRTEPLTGYEINMTSLAGEVTLWYNGVSVPPGRYLIGAEIWSGLQPVESGQDITGDHDKICQVSIDGSAPRTLLPLQRLEIDRKNEQQSVLYVVDVSRSGGATFSFGCGIKAYFGSASEKVLLDRLFIRPLPSDWSVDTNFTIR